MVITGEDELKTTSRYINNLLLARGLLRNNKSVDFTQLARPTRRKGTSGDISNAELAVQIINIVHDLILRGDRDQDHQESLVSTIKTLRTEAVRTNVDIDRLRSLNAGLRRNLVVEQTTARNAMATVRKAEGSARALREEIARIKLLLAQVRTQCANDVRKRDVEIQRLKAHLVGQQRGSKTAIVAASITINHGNSTRSVQTESADTVMRPGLQDAEYSLRQENNEFLTELAHSLADENDALIAMVKGTVSTLHELQGLSHNQQPGMWANASTGYPVRLTTEQHVEEPLQIATISVNELSGTLQDVLSRLRDLLTNPSFAPIEEVQAREEEIHKLRDGWEIMESKWREAVTMMKGWRERMLSGGNTVNLEELKIGLRLGGGIEDSGRSSPRSSRSTPDTDEKASVDEATGDHIPPHHDAERDSNASDVITNPASPECQRSLRDQPTTPRSTNTAMFVLKLGPTARYPVLNPVDGNKYMHSAPQTNKVRFNDSGIQGNGHSTHLHDGSQGPSPCQPMNKEARLSTLHSIRSFTTERSLLTVQQKLDLAASEARQVSSPFDLQQSVPPRTGSSPVKRTGIVGRPQRARRRKSTLSPAELEDLMLGHAA